ncbi:MAG: indole acetimide hydrolase, partial [Proteobacteria bacterium]|nr:indole acetimide hydrolase [Pseudomonadota bacterium]
MMRAGETSSARIVAELLRRAGEAQSLNAFITIDAEGALARAEELDQMRSQGEILGPLHGLPLVVKDNIHVAGLPNTAGTPGLREFTPAADNAVIAALLDAGALIIGKTNMHELAFGITSDNAAFGAVANPFDTTTFAGGSSGGTASAIAAGVAPAGLGTDTGGSVRIPAALTGTAGFRPSNGRYPLSGVTPIS